MDSGEREQRRREDLVFRGVAVAPGQAIGKVHIHRDIYSREHQRFQILPQEADREYGRIERAIDKVLEELEWTAERVEQELTPDMAEIFRAQRQMLADETLRNDLKEGIEKELVNAEQVVKTVFRRWEKSFLQSDQEDADRYASDVYDLGRRVLQILAGIQSHALEHIPAGSVLVAKQLLPSDTVFLSHRSTVGVVVEHGGKTSHAALLTREMGIPCVAGIHDVLEIVEDGDIAMVDGTRAQVTIAPSDGARRKFEDSIRRGAAMTEEMRRLAQGPARTRDDVRISVLANVGSVEDVKNALKNGAEGVGLYRIEQFYLAHRTLPTEQDIVDEVMRTLEPLDDQPAVVRLLDVGADKEVPTMQFPEEIDPALGLRGVRLLLQYRDLLETQLRAMVRIMMERRISVLIPFVTLAEEVDEVRRILCRVAGEMDAGQMPRLGAMIETPAAALSSADIAAQADFLSVGTNDLTQYTMAAGRENPSVHRYFEEDHPAVLELLRTTVERAGKVPVSLCGEMAGSAEAVPRLIALGFRELSVAPPLVPAVKEAVRESRARGCD